MLNISRVCYGIEKRSRTWIFLKISDDVMPVVWYSHFTVMSRCTGAAKSFSTQRRWLLITCVTSISRTIYIRASRKLEDFRSRCIITHAYSCNLQLNRLNEFSPHQLTPLTVLMHKNFVMQLAKWLLYSAFSLTLLLKTRASSLWSSYTKVLMWHFVCQRILW